MDYDSVLDRAVEAFEAKDYARARNWFERAYALQPNARVLRGMGISALHLEHFTVAKRELTAALEDTRQPLTESQREGVTELLSWMSANLGTLRLDVQPAGARVAVDDDVAAEAEFVLSPGPHRLHTSADGFDANDQTINVTAGKDHKLSIVLAPKTPAHEEPVDVSPVATASAAPVPEARPTSAPIAPAQTPGRDGESSSVLESWWFWTAVGVVVAAGVTTAVVATSAPSKNYEKGGLGGVIMPLSHAP